MKRLLNFTKDESGAVTVDWVVLTAAIVGIALAVIGLISSGVEDASTGINDELQTASAFTFSGGAVTGTSKISELLAATDYDNTRTVIANEAPTGYGYFGGIDTATDTAIYSGNTPETNGTYSVNGEVLNAADYDPFTNGFPY